MAAIDDLLTIADDTAFAIAMSDLVWPRWDRDGFAALTPVEQVVYCVDAFEREVNNGGLRQFFDNSSGDTALETVGALESIGATGMAAVLREATAVFPDRVPPADRDARQQLVDALPPEAFDRWSALEEAFHATGENLAALLREFAARHRAGFRDA